jgi:hypothetical protein
MPEPRFPPASAEAAPAADPALGPGPAAARTDDPNGSGFPDLLTQILAVVLGLVAAALALRQVALRTRGRHPPAGHATGGRHARTGTAPGQDQTTPVPPDPPAPRRVPPEPGRAGSRRP